MSIVRPSTEQVSMYLEKWDSLENYVLQEGRQPQEIVR